MPGSTAAAAAATGVTFGDSVRYWRRVRAMSQLDLAAAAMTTSRHMSFLETGRSKPSREMVLRLADALEVPLRDRNGLLLAAGFAPLYPHRQLDDPTLARVEEALDRMLNQHDPFPAVVMDRGWNLLRANDGAQRLFGLMWAPRAVPDAGNVLRLILEPGPVRSHIANWEELAPALLERARREAVGGVLDLATAELVQELRTRPDVKALTVRAEDDCTVRSGRRRALPAQPGGSPVLLGGVHDRDSHRRHGARAPSRSLLPRRRRDGRSLAGDRRVIRPDPVSERPSRRPRGG